MKVKSDSDQSLLAFVTEQLDRLPGTLHTRRMFGSHAVHCDDVFFAIVYKGRLYFRTNETTKSRYQALGMPPFQPGDTPFRYHQVPVEVLEDAERLTEWAQEAIAVKRADQEKRTKHRKKSDRFS
ncbi:MAG TPA: TfoX/Sxy family protein [Oculatellaceae cyanobacterium]